jgi:hypothetical protein
VLRKSGRLGDINGILEKIERDWQPISAPGRHDPDLSGRYRAYLEESVSELRLAARQQDMEAARRIAHRLRGTAIHFGYGSVGVSAGELGKAIASGDSRVIGVALDALLEHLAEAIGQREETWPKPAGTATP